MTVKYIITTLSVILLISAGCSRFGGVESPTGPSEVRPKVFMDPATVSPGNGETFTLNVYMENVTDLYYAAFYVIYDPNKVSYISSATGNFLKQDGVTVNDPPYVGNEQSEGNGLVKRSFGISRFDSNTPKSGVSGTGILCTITFKAIATDTPSIGFSEDTNDQGFKDVNDSDIVITVGNGTTVNIR